MKSLFPKNTMVKRFLAAVAEENSQEDEKKEDEYFQKMYQQWKGVKAKNDSTYKVIPKFYFKVLLVS